MENLQNHIGALIEESHYARILAIDKAPYLDAFIRGESVPPFEIEIQPSSKCNLKCRWCLGEEVQAQNKVLNLPNLIHANNIDRIVEGILGTKQNGLGVETVKFSGFIGEPLIRKQNVLTAMKKLVSAGVKVGLFTNGVLMTKETWETLASIAYVHISLDAGPRSFSRCKENRMQDDADAPDMFYRILDNIRGLALKRKKIGNGKKMDMMIGYVVTEANHDEIYEVSRLVREAGADLIRFKCDITGKFDLCKAGVFNEAFSQIEQAQADFHKPPEFSVIAIHSRNDVENKTFANWNCSNGCYYQYFCTTIGSDGNVYLCDHNTMPGAIPLGNAINQPFSHIWDSIRRKFLAKFPEQICLSSVCPPFGRRINAFLAEITALCDIHGEEAIIAALELVRNEAAKIKEVAI